MFEIAKIVNAFEIKLTIKSNLFKNGCLFIHSIQQNKIYWPIATIHTTKFSFFLNYLLKLFSSFGVLQ